MSSTLSVLQFFLPIYCNWSTAYNKGCNRARADRLLNPSMSVSYFQDQCSPVTCQDGDGVRSYFQNFLDQVICQKGDGILGSLLGPGQANALVQTAPALLLCDAPQSRKCAALSCAHHHPSPTEGKTLSHQQVLSYRSKRNGESLKPLSRTSSPVQEPPYRKSVLAEGLYRSFVFAECLAKAQGSTDVAALKLSHKKLFYRSQVRQTARGSSQV